MRATELVDSELVFARRVLRRAGTGKGGFVFESSFLIVSNNPILCVDVPAGLATLRTPRVPNGIGTVGGGRVLGPAPVVDTDDVRACCLAGCVTGRITEAGRAIAGFRILMAVTGGTAVAVCGGVAGVDRGFGVAGIASFRVLVDGAVF